MTEISTLIIYSNPSNSERIRLDKEHREIDKILDEMGLPRETVVRLHASTIEDISRYLVRQKFSMLQFSGHGSSGGIFVESADSESGMIVDYEKLGGILESASPHLGIAMFMSCFSAEIADMLIKYVPIIISVQGEANDEASIEFVKVFYKEFLRNGDVGQAFKLATFDTSGRLNAVFLRRGLVDGDPRALVTHSRFGEKDLLIDIKNISDDISRFGLSREKLISLLQNKIQYHRWAFRYPRHAAIFPIGMYFASFRWENPDDVIYCNRIFKLKQDTHEDLAECWVSILIGYHDCYVLDYRSPYLAETRKSHALGKGINLINELFGRCFEDAKRVAQLRSAAPEAFVTARAIGIANLRAAEHKFHLGEFGSSISHLEAALSCVHDLVDAVGDSILE